MAMSLWFSGEVLALPALPVGQPPAVRLHPHRAAFGSRQAHPGMHNPAVPASRCLSTESDGISFFVWLQDGGNARHKEVCGGHYSVHRGEVRALATPVTWSTTLVTWGYYSSLCFPRLSFFVCVCHSHRHVLTKVFGTCVWSCRCT